jgi:hypothetical protein
MLRAMARIALARPASPPDDTTAKYCEIGPLF